MKVQKDGIIKEVEKNIMSDYISAGWKEHKETKTNKEENILKTTKNIEK